MVGLSGSTAFELVSSLLHYGETHFGVGELDNVHGQGWLHSKLCNRQPPWLSRRTHEALEGKEDDEIL